MTRTESKPNRSPVKINSTTGAVEIKGQTHGAMRIISHDGTTLVVREKGRSYWAGLNMPRGYQRARTRTFEIKGPWVFWNGAADGWLVADEVLG